MIVMKFGGTSVAGFEAISRTISIVESRLDRNPVVVVSAMSKITDLLYAISDKAVAKDMAGAKELLDQLRSRHITTAEQLLEGHVEYMLPAISAINELCDNLESFVNAICALGELSPRSKAILVSNGELLSSTIIGYAMNARGIKTQWLDARKMIITDGNHMEGDPDLALISERVPQIVKPAMEDNAAVITQGFISSTAEGNPTVLGRGGSDYTASLIGMAMDAEVIEIWTDVDGILTADPRVVPTARPLQSVSFAEAAEMAHFGAKVLHPLTIEPALKKNIPIYVLNSMNPSCPGTAIRVSAEIEDGVKSVSFKENIKVINMFSTKMINVSGFLGKVFSIFSENKVSVDLISTSEANISVTVDAKQNIDSVVEKLSEFADVTIDTDKAQISIVGQNLLQSGDVMPKFSAAIRGLHVYMISQGASLINVSIVVDKDNLRETVNNIHNSLFV